MPAYSYQEVTPYEATTESRIMAYEMKAFVEKDLQLPGLTIRWFKKVVTPLPWRESFQNNKDIAGTVFLKDTRTIWVSAELTPQATGKTLAHEARHCYQRARGQEGNEADAQRYEEFAIRAYAIKEDLKVTSPGERWNSNAQVEYRQGIQGPRGGANL